MAPKKTYQDLNAVVRAFPTIEQEITRLANEARTTYRRHEDYDREDLSRYIKKAKRATDYLVRSNHPLPDRSLADSLFLETPREQVLCGQESRVPDALQKHLRRHPAALPVRPRASQLPRPQDRAYWWP